MIVPVMAISNLVLTQQIYSEETNGAHAHYREPVPLNRLHEKITSVLVLKKIFHWLALPRIALAKCRQCVCLVYFFAF